MFLDAVVLGMLLLKFVTSKDFFLGLKLSWVLLPDTRVSGDAVDNVMILVMLGLLLFV